MCAEEKMLAKRREGETIHAFALLPAGVERKKIANARTSFERDFVVNNLACGVVLN
jgi:hypothetical protein